MGRKPLMVIFYQSEQGNQPVKDFLKERSKEDKKAIGADIFKVQMGFPMEEPLGKPIKNTNCLWEVRSTIPDGICRVFFTVADSKMVLIHAFTKKTQKLPFDELKTAIARLKNFNKRLREQRAEEKSGKKG